VWNYVTFRTIMDCDYRSKNTRKRRLGALCRWAGQHWVGRLAIGWHSAASSVSYDPLGTCRLRLNMDSVLMLWYSFSCYISWTAQDGSKCYISKLGWDRVQVRRSAHYQSLINRVVIYKLSICVKIDDLEWPWPVKTHAHRIHACVHPIMFCS